MKDFKGKTAVITGAASGIGWGLAKRCAEEGMNVVLADVEEKSLADTEREMKVGGASVLAVLTDVSKAGDIKALAEKTLETYGAVHLLFNNAGVYGGWTTWESTEEDWQWTLGVNLWGVIHGVRVFIPIMLKQDIECHVVNTASVAGLMSGPGEAIYKVTKHAVVALSETLYHELRYGGPKIGVSVFCPWFVNTRVMTCERNRPSRLLNAPDLEREWKANPTYQMMWRMVDDGVKAGMSCQQAADCVFNGIKGNEFYIFTDTNITKSLVQLRMEDILQERNPTNPVSVLMPK
ncbi:MAG: 3-oxoacyl-ACP reductase [Chloroflexi bacterium RBG_13_53_26]|jgi:NAD(P)-dependent dehydrogenase (short-subunit alcohol dehydrogenase family)|nr:MAG: 3-oxoacyl-ACP reductase [Chloroflexi bacterium RBG_13_53_26]